MCVDSARGRSGDCVLGSIRRYIGVISGLCVVDS